MMLIEDKNDQRQNMGSEEFRSSSHSDLMATQLTRTRVIVAYSWRVCRSNEQIRSLKKECLMDLHGD